MGLPYTYTEQTGTPHPSYSSISKVQKFSRTPRFFCFGSSYFHFHDCLTPLRDVTDVFEAFHDDPRQRRKLEAFRVGTLVGYTPSPLVEDFRALKQEIAEEGLFEVGRVFRVVGGIRRIQDGQ